MRILHCRWRAWWPDQLSAFAGDRAVVVTDMAAAGISQAGALGSQVGEDLAAWAPGKEHLVGAAMSMQMNAILHERLPNIVAR